MRLIFNSIKSYIKSLLSEPDKQQTKSLTSILLQKALAHHQQSNLNEAEQLYREILQIDNENSDALNLLSILISSSGQYKEAVHLLERAIKIKPTPEYYNNLGTIHHNNQRYEDAIVAYKNSTQLNPGFTEAYFGLGNSYFQTGQFELARQSYTQTLEITPEHVNANYNLGNALRELGQLEQAISAFELTLQIDPQFYLAYNNLGFLLQEQGRLDEAIACYKNAISIESNFMEAESNLLNCLNNLPDVEEHEIYEEHRRWAQRYSSVLNRHSEAHQTKSDSNRRLKIGYVSPDFRKHSVAIFIEPVLGSHNRDKFEVFAYFNYPNSDDATHRIRELVENWRDIASMNHEQVCELIIDDNIDILIDLSGHTGNNRLLVFAQKPAPVQISYLGYPNTTGLPNIDYRLTDNIADPIGLTESYYSEELIRLPDAFLCYKAPERSPDVGKLPALNAGYITFGCFNNATKLNEAVVKLWSRILKQIPDSRLLLKATQFGDRISRERILQLFETHEITGARIDFAGLTGSFYEHLEMYNKVDIALDCFPYNGTTTTCETLWMGVPVIVRSGNVHRARVGSSILQNVGLPQFIASDANEFVSIATSLARNQEELITIRSSLRDIMRNSKLMDAKTFTSSLEQIYKRIQPA